MPDFSNPRQVIEDNPASLRDLMRQPPTTVAAHREITQRRVNARRLAEDIQFAKQLQADNE